MKRQGQGYFYRQMRPTTYKKKQGDPYFFVLAGQGALCALVLLAVFALRDLRPTFWEPLAAQYIALMVKPMQGEWEWTGDLRQWYTSWKEETLDAISVGIEKFVLSWEEQPAQVSASASLPKPQAEASLPQPQAALSEPAQQPAADATLQVEPLTGMGGWFGRGEAVNDEIPQSCTMAPIFLSAQLRSPIGGRVTSLFGWREHPITEEEDFHRGLDIAAPTGTAVRAPLPGKVVEVGESSIYGNFITLDHGNGLQTTFSHCSEIVAEEGENLRSGELLAKVGSTGISTGPHLHFELRKNDVYYNPLWTLLQISRSRGDNVNGV